ncbi:putative efflux transporter [Bifidobacterium actinocoloniiforme DSM 22766]|uniref:Putative efflux transporter n=2 Tax=Bifidobacterium actinocoloniiforme TaxID=638619 RepID=A0A086Z091_9BIFI|nr:MFS transporter [Bifidobacterium actinocoloniiforme]KFI39941.1 putative efflux transporter [Bifidobacterium actinocoloniiforme DSM 22766]
MGVIGLCLLLVMACGVLFIWRERQLAADIMPFLPIGLLKRPAYSLTLLLGALGGMLFSLFVYIPTYVHVVFGMPVRRAGMVMVGVGLGSIIGSWLGGLLVDNKGKRFTLVVSSLLIGVVSILITFTLTSLPMFRVLSLALGIGLGAMMSSPLQVIAGNMADSANRMRAMGGLSATKKIGTAIAPLIFATAIEVGKSGGQAGLPSFRNMFMVAAVIALLAVLITLFIPLKAKDE